MKKNRMTSIAVTMLMVSAMCVGCQENMQAEMMPEVSLEGQKVLGINGEPIPTDGRVPEPEATPILAPEEIIEVTLPDGPSVTVLLTPIPLEMIPSPLPTSTIIPETTPEITEKPIHTSRPKTGSTDGSEGNPTPTMSLRPQETSTPTPYATLNPEIAYNTPGLEETPSAESTPHIESSPGMPALSPPTAFPTPISTPVPTPAPTSSPSPTPEPEIDFDGQGEAAIFETITLAGKSISSEKLFGQAKLTMVNMWGTYCGPCIAEMPSLAKLHEEYADLDFQVVGLLCNVANVEDDLAEEGRKIAEETGADNYTHLLVSDSLKQTLLKGVTTIPYTLFFDEEGKLVCDPVSGAKSYEVWAGKVEQLYAAAEIFSRPGAQITPTPSPTPCVGSS